MINLIEAKNPKWSNSEKTRIDIECNFDHIPEEFVWFTADENDKMPYGREIFQRAVNGEYGTISEFIGE